MENFIDRQEDNRRIFGFNPRFAVFESGNEHKVINENIGELFNNTSRFTSKFTQMNERLKPEALIETARKTAEDTLSGPFQKAFDGARKAQRDDIEYATRRNLVLAPEAEDAETRAVERTVRERYHSMPLSAFADHIINNGGRAEIAAVLRTGVPDRMHIDPEFTRRLEDRYSYLAQEAFIRKELASSLRARPTMQSILPSPDQIDEAALKEMVLKAESQRADRLAEVQLAGKFLTDYVGVLSAGLNMPADKTFKMLMGDRVNG